MHINLLTTFFCSLLYKTTNNYRTAAKTFTHEQTYPNKFGLNSFNIFGSVKCDRQFPWPPIHQDTPRFSIKTSQRAAEFAEVALVNESPIAITISISPENIFIFSRNGFELKMKFGKLPGRNLLTFVGIILLRYPFVLHGNLTEFGTRFCRKFPLSRFPVPPKKLLDKYIVKMATICNFD